MLDLAGWGKLAGGLGSLAGGLGFGSSGGGIKGSDLRKQQRVFLDTERRKYASIVKGAKEAGIHPMYALGSAGSFSPTVSSSAGGGVSPGQIGEGVAQIAGAFGKKDPTSRALTELGLRQANAETLRSEYATEMAWLDLQREKQKPNLERQVGASATTYPATKPNEPVLLKINADGKVIDVTGMPTVEPMEEYFGEIGEFEQSLRNLWERWKRSAGETNPSQRRRNQRRNNLRGPR